MLRLKAAQPHLRNKFKKRFSQNPKDLRCKASEILYHQQCKVSSSMQVKVYLEPGFRPVSFPLTKQQLSSSSLPVHLHPGELCIDTDQLLRPPQSANSPRTKDDNANHSAALILGLLEGIRDPVQPFKVEPQLLLPRLRQRSAQVTCTFPAHSTGFWSSL